jgi:hypothetical protein
MAARPAWRLGLLCFLLAALAEAQDFSVTNLGDLQAALGGTGLYGSIAAGDAIIITANHPSFQSFTGSINYPAASPAASLTLRGAAGQTIILSGDNANQWLAIEPGLILHLENLTFQDADTTPLTFSSSLDGGGIVSAYDYVNPVFIGNLTGNTFRELGVEILASSTNIHGSGVVGAYSFDGAATIGNLTGANTFSDIKVVMGSSIHGGGVVGASSINGAVAIGDLTNGNTFSGIEVSVAPNDINSSRGGGVVGARSALGAATIGNLTGANTFTGIRINSTVNNFYGGGVIGAESANSATIGDLTNANTFADIMVPDYSVNTS